jgi:CTP synthase
VIVPGGFGLRGIEGKIKVIQYVRENDVPYLGICYGMQLAVVEYARNVAGLKDANTTEVREEGINVPHPVIDILPGQINVTAKGGTMRLGGHDVEIKTGTRAFSIFGNKALVRQRFRHRYEVNPDYIARLEEKGLVFSGKHPSENIMQVMELPGHKYFMGSQFHPELTSNLRNPSPLFYHLVKASIPE